MKERRTFEQRFWRKVDRSGQGPKGCWPWTGYKGENGRGYMHGPQEEGQGQKLFLVHRLAYTFSYGPIPAGDCVWRRCGTLLCCKPSHLFAGPLKDMGAILCSFNQNPGHRKLLPDQVRTIKESLRAKVNVYDLAAQFNVTANTIRDIRSGRSWRTVTIEETTPWNGTSTSSG